MIATVDNTVFYTFVTHDDADRYSAPLRKTADFFGVPLVKKVWRGFFFLA